MPRAQEGTREELARFERRELCAFFKGNHGNASTVAAHVGNISLFDFCDGREPLEIRLHRRKQNLRASLALSRRGMLFPTKTM